MTTIKHVRHAHATTSARHAAHHGRNAHSAGGNAAVATLFTPAPRTALKDMSVKERFSTLNDRFLPSKAKGVNVRFQFDISGSGGGQWYVEIKGGKLTVKTGTGPNPTATLHASAENYMKIANGKMNKMWALVTGKLKVEGDKDALKQWDNYFSGNSVKD